MTGVVYSGFPQTATGGSNNANSYGNARPNQYRSLKIRNRNIHQWFGDDPSAIACGLDANGRAIDNGVCAFGQPSENATGGSLFGTSRNGNLRGPGYRNFDASAFKDFRTFREQSLGFRFDAFNVFNIVSYGNPDTNVFDSNFGDIGTSVRSVERHLQFSANYRF